MHLDKLQNAEVNFIRSLDHLQLYTFYKIQNKLKQTASRR